MTGKEKCELLRAIRREIAERNGIEYLSAECHHEGDCLGTCPKCDAEARFLNSELERLVREGKSVDYMSGVIDIFETAIEDQYDKATDNLCAAADTDEDYNGESYTMGEMRIDDDISKEKILEMSLEELDFSLRTYNCLYRAGIRTVEDIISLSYEDPMKVCNLGKKIVDEIIEKIDELGFELSHDDDEDFFDDETSEKDTEEDTDPKSMSIEELDLSTRTVVYLRKRGIYTVEDLVSYDSNEHFVVGSASPRPDMNEVREKLAELGLSLKNDEYYE
ncbi:MAG: DNA-directed RNA polymerase subunit alpha C-terminal domain-containing protein [Oscillospiraceae bacterium]